MKSLLIALLLCFTCSTSAWADKPHLPQYSKITASADGIGKAYMGREIAKVMTYHGADWLERAERVKEERPDLVLGALDLKPGMMVADIGAGTGYYSRRIALQVGNAGAVYAVDIQPEMLTLLQRETARRGVTNVKPVLATPTDIGLPPDTLDLAVMVDVYHELEYPYEVLASIVRALKPSGRIVFVEFRANDPGVPIKRLHTMSERQIRKEAAAFPLSWVKSTRGLPWQHAVVFQKSR